MLSEALAAGRTPEGIYVTDAGWHSMERLHSSLGERVFMIPSKAMAKLSDLETPPGVLAVYPLLLDDLQSMLATGEPAIVLAGIADPGNAGTLLRSAEIFGIRHAIFARDAVETHNPKVIRATMGAIFRMRLAVSAADELVLGARIHGFALVAAARDGIALPQFTFVQRSLLVLGNERRGVAGWLPRWDFGVAIPQQGDGESLNASVAGGIIFYTFAQQFSRNILESPHAKNP